MLDIPLPSIFYWPLECIDPEDDVIISIITWETITYFCNFNEPLILHLGFELLLDLLSELLLWKTKKEKKMNFTASGKLTLV